MPLKLYPPTPGRGSPNWRIRGVYLGVRVDQSAGTGERRIAARALASIKRQIETGAFAERGGAAPTFAGAAVTYMQAGGERRFVEPILLKIGARPLADIDQATVNALAASLYPGASPATLNRQVYTPVIAIMRAGGITAAIKRPKGARGEARTFWLREDALFAVLRAGQGRHARFAALLEFLSYTGARLSEALRMTWDDVELGRAYALLRRTKNSEPQAVHLPPHVVATLANLPREHGQSAERRMAYKTVFGFQKAGRLYALLDEVCESAGVEIPAGVAFHAFRHTYAAMMRRHAGLDTSGLVATGRWKDRGAAAVYEHVEASEEARKADLLPVMGKIRAARKARQ